MKGKCRRQRQLTGEGRGLSGPRMHDTLPLEPRRQGGAQLGEGQATAANLVEMMVALLIDLPGAVAPRGLLECVRQRVHECHLRGHQQ